MNDPIFALEVENLAVEYPLPGRGRRRTRVIEDVTFSVARQETLALVGESGSGKTTIGRAVLGLTPVAAGSIKLEGREISRLTRRKRRPLATSLQAIFQNPYGSLNPSLKIGDILSEPLLADGQMTKVQAMRAIADLLRRVGMPEDTVDRYPANFSGGQRQRIAIARAVARNPRVIVCDEPTSALDVTTQAAALTLLAELQENLGVSYLFITHDLAVVREFAHRVIVLQKGRIVETGQASEVCERPQDEYTRQLVAAAPVPDPVLQRKRRSERLTAS